MSETKSKFATIPLNGHLLTVCRVCGLSRPAIREHKCPDVLNLTDEQLRKIRPEYLLDAHQKFTVTRQRLIQSLENHSTALRILDEAIEKKSRMTLQ